MKKVLFSILSAFMVSTMASAQYVNVKLDDGTWHSYKTSAKTVVSFGEKKGTDPTESDQMVVVNGHTVTVKLADGTPASEVMICAYIEGESVNVGAFSRLNHRLECVMDGEAVTPAVSNGFHTFTLSDISKDVVVTVGYINVIFDLNNSGMNGNFTVKPDGITKIGYNTTVTEPDRPFSDKYGFRGWYKDKECTEAWNFSTDKVTKSITLYAKWKEDPTGTQINGHDFVKLGGYYWAIRNVYQTTGVTAKIDGNENTGSYYTQIESQLAARSWGGQWSLPSEAQWQVLLKYCDWEWKGDGYLVKGRDDNYESDHSIFLPAAGIYIDGYDDVDDQGDFGYYWSADSARYLRFYDANRGMRDDGPGYGMAVRPVSE